MQLNRAISPLVDDVGSLNSLCAFRKDQGLDARPLVLLSRLHHWGGNDRDRLRVILIDEISDLLVLFSLSDSSDIARGHFCLTSIFLNDSLRHYLLGSINGMPDID